MPISATCPGCGKKLGIPDDFGGKVVKCPSCAVKFKAPLMGDFWENASGLENQPIPESHPSGQVVEVNWEHSSRSNSLKWLQIILWLLLKRQAKKISKGQAGDPRFLDIVQ